MSKRSSNGPSSAPRPAPKPEPIKRAPPIVHHGKVDRSNTASRSGWGGKR